MRDTYDYITSWARALEGAAADRGWSLLSDEAQAGFDDKRQYVHLAESADWSVIEITPLIGRCDDLYACSVSVLVAGDPSRIPEFLVHSPNLEDDSSHHLLQIADRDDDGVIDAPDGDLGNGAVNVRWERVPWPDPGIGG